MTKAETKLIRLVSKANISDEEATELLEQIMNFAREIRDEFKLMYDPKERA